MNEWVDQPIVRPFAMVGGRTRSSGDTMDLIALVTATGSPPGGFVPGPEHARIIVLTRSPSSVADIAAEIDLPLGVVRVLLGDLLDQGLISVRRPGEGRTRPSERILKEVINGLRAL
jgi:hypothetical protein